MARANENRPEIVLWRAGVYRRCYFTVLVFLLLAYGVRRVSPFQPLVERRRHFSKNTYGQSKESSKPWRGWLPRRYHHYHEIEVDDGFEGSDAILPDVTRRAELDRLVGERAEARWEGDYARADALRRQIDSSVLLPDGFDLVLRDLPRSEGGGSTW